MSKPKDQQETARTAAKADDEDPVGSCQFTNNSGQIVCIDNMKKSECDQIENSIFIEDATCN
jgi:hypothetical protein